MKTHKSLVPKDFSDLYNLDSLLGADDFYYVEIRGGMRGLPQAGRLAHDELVAHLAPCGYSPVKFTPGLWTNKALGVTFTLAVDDFGIKCLSLSHLHHLKEALETKYAVTLDITGNLYLGVTLKWDYPSKQVTCSMPGYIPKLLERLKHESPTIP